MLTIWVNRSYATTHHVIALLRENPDHVSVRVVGTHADLSSPVLAACDEAEAEPGPEVAGEAYVAWALEFCARHRVDVFVPRVHLNDLSAARDLFAAAGVALVAAPADAAALVDDKQRAYEDAARAGLPVPPHRVVRDAEALVAAFDSLAEEVGTVCLKPVTGVGGEGFRVLTRERARLTDFLAHPGVAANVEEVAAAMERHHADGLDVPPMMLMPFLPGPEVSVDTLADRQGRVLAAVPRRKMGRAQELVEDLEATAVAASIVGRHRLGFLTNTQVRYWRHPLLDSGPRPYLLETNARMSGGVHQSALSGVNLPWAAVQMALGRPVTLDVPRFGARYTTVPQTVALQERRGPCRDQLLAHP